MFGLIGYPLGHSRSAAIFNEKFVQEGIPFHSYHLFPLNDLKEFQPLVENHPDLIGLNVTVPYKEKIISFLDDLDETAQKVGAVNAILISRKGGRSYTRGYNTDVAGFLRSLPGSFPGLKAMVLGTGGAAKAVAYALGKLGIDPLFISRSVQNDNTITYPEITKEIMDQYWLIINATPIGMYPETAVSPPIPYQFLTRDHFLYDLIYNPPQTLFLKSGQDMGCQVMNGEKMLLFQADQSWELFRHAIL